MKYMGSFFFSGGGLCGTIFKSRFYMQASTEEFIYAIIRFIPDAPFIPSEKKVWLSFNKDLIHHPKQLGGAKLMVGLLIRSIYTHPSRNTSTNDLVRVKMVYILL